MTVVYLLCVLVFLVAANWRFLGLDKLFRQLGSRRECNWRIDPTMRGGGYGRYVCRTCGAEAFTSNGRAPKECRRAMRRM